MSVSEKDLERNLVETKNGIGIRVYVVPRAGKTRLTYRDGELIFFSGKNPKHHAVNRDLIKFFSRLFENSKQVSIIKGKLDRLKIVEVSGSSREELLTKLLRAVSESA
ncbi:MAG: hypothetical protein DRN68_07660 [Thaumarchaeota archaeon]|nr:MAG: hypothetical protein DRN68_07660 [Nitrososphaerota archaeon]HDM88379.1 hypothetical protein [Candidatus Bathyarchaeota archaeon]